MKNYWLLILLSFCTLAFACSNNNKQSISVTFTVTKLQDEESTLQEISSYGSVKDIVEGVTCVTWVSDNQRIAYSQAGNIYIRELSLNNTQSFEISFWTLSHPVWSPMGDKLAFAGKEKEDASRNIWLLDVKEGSLESVTSCIGNASECFISAPDWSMNNKLTYWESKGQVNSIVEYDIIERNVSTVLPLDIFLGESFTFGNNNTEFNFKAFEITTPSLAWSPDGIHLALVDNNLPSNVLILNTQTQEVVNVTQSSTLSVEFDSPLWSSDGQWLLLRKIRMEKYDFWEPVGYDIVLVNIENGLSNGEFQFDVLFQSDDALICPRNLTIAE